MSPTRYHCAILLSQSPVLLFIHKFQNHMSDMMIVIGIGLALLSLYLWTHRKKEPIVKIQCFPGLGDFPDPTFAQKATQGSAVDLQLVSSQPHETGTILWGGLPPNNFQAKCIVKMTRGTTPSGSNDTCDTFLWWIGLREDGRYLEDETEFTNHNGARIVFSPTQVRLIDHGQVSGLPVPFAYPITRNNIIELTLDPNNQVTVTFNQTFLCSFACQPATGDFFVLGARSCREGTRVGVSDIKVWV